MASGIGLIIAQVVSHFFESTAFVFMIGVAFFGGPFIWIMILVTHLAFRRANERAGKTVLRFAPRGPVEFAFWIGCAGRGADFHVVGARPAYHADGRVELAGDNHGALSDLVAGGAGRSHRKIESCAR